MSFLDSIIEIYDAKSVEKVKAVFQHPLLDPLLLQAVEVFHKTGNTTSLLLQQYLNLGYDRSHTLIDQLEEIGIIMPIKTSIHGPFVTRNPVEIEKLVKAYC